ncbi:hypothetical protein V9T40_005934 [Parthenolecanium corni]|uniref:BTB domain-containing protein n=1 Tax=Parthenolecanium corni TaxID=536013 RepID=A0AAN9U436_9HEMI
MSLRDWPVLRQLSPNFLTTVRIAFVFGQKGNAAFMITGDDKVYSVGKNISYCLGLNDDDNDDDMSTAVPSLNSVLSNKNVDGFTCGGDFDDGIFMIARLQNGDIYQWGSLPRTSYDEASAFPMRVEFDVEVKVKAVACGFSHCMILSNDGRVFTWGDNEAGQLGHSEQLSPSQYSHSNGTSTPSEVKGCIEGKVVIDISCGGRFSVVILEGGKVCSWGFNHRGQLGINSKDVHSSVPVLVSALNNVVIEKITCGVSHVLALSKKHELYGWGNNSMSELGIPNPINQRRGSSRMCRRPVECGKNLRFVDICASYAGALSVAQCESGEIYMWGKMSSGKIVTQPTDSQCDSIHQVFAFYASPNIMPKPMRHVLEAKRRTTMSRTLESEFGNPNNADLTICVDNREIHVHQAILKMRSAYFKSLLSRWLKENEKVVTIKGKSFAAVEAYLKYIYTDRLEVNIELAVELLQLADEYGDDSFKLLCEQSIKRDLTTEKVADLFAFTRKLEMCQDLNKFCLDYALNHAEKLINSQGFKKWDLDTMTAFTVEHVKKKKTDYSDDSS